MRWFVGGPSGLRHIIADHVIATNSKLSLGSFDNGYPLSSGVVVVDFAFLSDMALKIA
jgi:hypothetical protein